MFPFEPLIKAVDFLPKKNCGVNILTPLPLNVVVPELCIVKSSAELLINDVDFLPKKKLGVSMFTPLPLNVVVPELCIFNSPLEPLTKFEESPKKNVGVSIDTLLPVIFILPFEPLMKLFASPNKNADELITTFEFSNLKNPPFDLPIKALGVPPLCSSCMPVFPKVVS